MKEREGQREKKERGIKMKYHQQTVYLKSSFSNNSGQYFTHLNVIFADSYSREPTILVIPASTTMKDMITL